jgi:ketosteroid isomerase-like protein
MKPTTAISILAFVGLSFFTCDYAVGQTPEPAELRAKDEQTIQKVPDDFSGAWNRHDMKAYSDLFTEDADVVVINGKHMKGRNEIFNTTTGFIRECSKSVH